MMEEILNDLPLDLLHSSSNSSNNLPLGKKKSKRSNSTRSVILLSIVFGSSACVSIQGLSLSCGSSIRNNFCVLGRGNQNIFRRESLFSTPFPFRRSDILFSTEGSSTATEELSNMTSEDEKAALASLEYHVPSSSGLENSDSSTMQHIHGYNDVNHELSMLQKITARQIRNYENIMADPHARTVDDLTNQMHDFESKHGPRLNLLQVIQSCQPAMALAAEFKRASPSKGPIAVHLDAGEQAVKYAKAGANVISILTEPHWFKGSVQDMREARLATQAVAAATDQTRPAILRKEFVTNTYQILEAAANGADTILLIVAITPSHLLKTLIDYARSIDMEPLVEVHAPQELDVALNAGAKVIGVNNRNLHTFQMDLATTDRTVEKLTQRNLSFFHDYDQDNTARDADNVSYSVCALSGMSNAEDVQRYRRLGVGMVLIGESLMRAQDPAAAIQGLCLHPKKYDEATSTLAGGAYTGGTKIVKVCGITNPEDALVACRSGASFIGVIFVPKSKRCVSIEQGQSIVSTVRAFGERTQSASIITSNNNNDNIVSNLISKTRVLENESRRPLVVGVFQNESSDQIRHVVETVGLDLVQLHGREGMEACSGCGVPAIRVVHIEASTDGEDNGKTSQERADAIINSLTGDPVAILLDTSVKGVQGGTGVTFDWDVATNLQNSGLPVLVAGGLNAQNVQKVVTDVRPWGVDVSSGVEGDKVGKKDVDAVDKFVKGARSAALEAQKGF